MYLGIDLGTSSLKIVLIDRQQRVIASATSPLQMDRPHPGWSEQNPADWIRATEEAMAEIKRQKPLALAGLKGIGLSGQMHGATLLDAQNRVLRPCILWNDTRSHVEAARMNEDERFGAITGNLVFPGFTAPKLAWLRKNEPEVFAAVAKVLLPKDFLRFWLTGEHISELSDASGTSWLDVGHRRWSPELLAATGLSLGQMPSKLVEGTEAAGILRQELAQEWGLPSGQPVIVAGGAGDNAASACGVGVIRPGTAFLSLGTSGVLFTASNEYRPNAKKGVHTFCHALPGTWHQMGVSLSATDSLNWLASVTGVGEAERLVAELGEELMAPGEVTFLPYLSGERTPHNDAHIRGAFIGLSHKTDRKALTQAVLEGVAFSFRDILDALRRSSASSGSTTESHQIIAIGGGSRSLYWLMAIATALNQPISVPKEGCSGAEGAAFGAARLGLIAAEAEDPWTVCTAPEIGQRVEPDEKLRNGYEAAYQRYRALYPALKALE